MLTEEQVARFDSRTRRLNRSDTWAHLVAELERGQMSQSGKVLDEYLVVATTAGDRRAADLLVKRWQSKLIAHAYRLTGDMEGSRDVVQAAWNEIMRGLGRLRDERAFPAWAYRIVTRGCAKHVRQIMRQRKVVSIMLAEMPVTTAAEQTAAFGNDQLKAAIRALPPDQRSAVALFYFEELSVAEVAVALEIPSGTVKTRLMHARRKLRAVLEGEE